MAIGTRLSTKGNVHWFIYPTNSFANWKAPTVTELNAAFDTAKASNAISYNDTDYGVQSSETLDDPSFAARGVTMSRGSSQFGGTLSFYYPDQYDDATNSLSRFYDMMTQRSEWYAIQRIDGELGWEDEFEAGQLITISKFMVAGEGQMITGADAFRYNITGTPRGELEVNAIVADADGLVTVTTATADAALSLGDIGIATAVVSAGTLDRLYTQGVEWTSSDTAVATVSRNGVIVPISAGTADITATYKATGDSSTPLSITVS